VYPNHHFRGKLFSVPASLLFFLSGELLKWQGPVLAAREKVALVSAHVRAIPMTSAAQFLRR